VERLVSRDHGNEREDLADEEALPHVGAGASRSAIDKAAVSGNQVVSPLRKGKEISGLWMGLDAWGGSPVRPGAKREDLGFGWPGGVYF